MFLETETCMSAPRRRVALFATAVLAIAGIGVAQAERLESPLELIYGEDAMLVAGPVVEVNPVGRVVIRRQEVLAGDEKPPEKIDIRVPNATLGQLAPGEKVIIAYSMFRRDPRGPVGLVANPDGAVALVSTGIEPAVFRDTREIRAILDAGRSEHGRESRRLLKLLLAALEGPDPQLQNLAAGEIALEPELAGRLDDPDRAILDAAVRNPKTFVNARMALLEAAARNPRLGTWWQAAALKIVTSTPTGGYSDAASDPVSLILLALEVLDRHAVTVPPDALKRWVWNRNPPLVERACLMLRREDPEAERSTIQKALADPKLPDPTRKFLVDHLRRLERLNARERARKEGSG